MAALISDWLSHFLFSSLKLLHTRPLDLLEMFIKRLWRSVVTFQRDWKYPRWLPWHLIGWDISTSHNYCMWNHQTCKKCSCRAKNKKRFVCCWLTDPPKLGPTQFFLLQLWQFFFFFAFTVNPDLYFSGLIRILL